MLSWDEYNTRKQHRRARSAQVVQKQLAAAVAAQKRQPSAATARRNGCARQSRLQRPDTVDVRSASEPAGERPQALANLDLTPAWKSWKWALPVSVDEKA